jgi:hypothetical protein
MNPNLEKLAKETKNPELAPKEPVNLCLVLDSCWKIDSALFGMIVDNLTAFLEHGWKYNILDKVCAINYATETKRGKWHSKRPVPNVRVSDAMIYDMHTYQGTESSLNGAEITQALSEVDGEKAVLVITDGCCAQTFEETLDYLINERIQTGIIDFGYQGESVEDFPNNVHFYPINSSAKIVPLSKEIEKATYDFLAKIK